MGLMPLVKKTRTFLFWEYNFKKEIGNQRIFTLLMFDPNDKQKLFFFFFTAFGLMIYSCFILFPCRDKHFLKPKTTSEFRLVSQKQSMESKFMLLLNGAIFYVPFEFLIFFSFLQIWNILIINIPHNSKTTQQVEMQEVSRPRTWYYWNKVFALELTHDTSSSY